MKKNLQKIIDFKIPLSFKYIKFSFIFIILAVFTLGFLESYKDGDIIWKIARNEAGELAWNLLIFIIFISLAEKIFKKVKIFKQLLPLRKEAGILVFLVVLAHTIFHFLRSDVFGDFEGMYFQMIERNWVILLGTISFCIMIPLFLTSSIFACKYIGYKFWKNLQRFSHLAFILSAIHVAFTQYPGHQEIDFGPLLILAIYILGYIYLFWNKKK